ncbi:hypothetical protein COLO4_25709 [Corchorus olitorius]|uniref:Uncharacterized protein n=1 Tax=Corchorus olitorius TaxID=93759 RepID=A0A1R3I0D7_9ROSI|nr:hypothetical protein COLO4_25709 [Corchorus olitorius]
MPTGPFRTGVSQRLRACFRDLAVSVEHLVGSLTRAPVLSTTTPSSVSSVVKSGVPVPSLQRSIPCLFGHSITAKEDPVTL